MPLASWAHRSWIIPKKAEKGEVSRPLCPTQLDLFVNRVVTCVDMARHRVGERTSFDWAANRIERFASSGQTLGRVMAPSEPLMTEDDARSV